MEEPTEAQLLLRQDEKVLARIRRYWKTPKDFSAAHYRTLVMSVDMTLIMTQVSVHQLIQQSVKAGDVPFYTTDAVLLATALLTALCAPIVSWLGFYRRRRTLVAWALLAFFTTFLLILTPSVGTKISEYCQISVFPIGKRSAAFRMVTLIIILMITTIVSAAYWCHGIAYIDENDSNSISSYGVLISVKVIAYALCYKVIGDIMSSSMWIHVVLLNLGYVVNVPQLLKASKEIERIGFDEQGFLTSMGRVLSNKQAIAHIITITFLLSGFWGSAYYHNDLIQTKYLYVEPKGNIKYTFTEIIYYLILILAIVYIGQKYSRPVISTFNKRSAQKVCTLLSASLFAMYIAISFFSCEKGLVAGLGAKEYLKPICSKECSCSSQLELNPVCVFDEMVTYLSPCHAGCTGVENLHGISVVTNCTCAGAAPRRAAAGACAASSCEITRGLFTAVYLFIVVLFTMALFLQIVLLLRCVDVRDKSVALGVLCSVAFAGAFGFGHVGYAAIAAKTCAWSDRSGVCKLHTSKFPYMIGFSSAGFCLLSALVSCTMFLLLRKHTSKETASDSSITQTGSLTVILE